MKTHSTCLHLALVLCPSLAACSGGAPDLEIDAATLGDTGELPDPDAESTGEPPAGDEMGPMNDDGPVEPGETGGPVGDESGGEIDDGETGDTGDTGDTGIEPQEAPEDGDHAANPGVRVQFRNTGGAPVSVEGPLPDLEEPIDTRGLQYLQQVSNRGDAEDWIAFNIVPGETDPVIDVALHCTGEDLDPQPLRAELLDGDGELLETIVCGQGPSSILLEQASSTSEYAVVVYALDGVEHFAEYTLEIDAFCFQSCTFSPYEP